MVFERFRLEDAEIVDQDIGVRHALDEISDALSRGKIGGDAVYLRTWHFLKQRLLGGIDLLAGAAIDHDTGARLRKPGRDQQSQCPRSIR